MSSGLGFSFQKRGDDPKTDLGRGIGLWWEGFSNGSYRFSYRCLIVFLSSSILVFPLRQAAEVPQAPLMAELNDVPIVL